MNDRIKEVRTVLGLSQQEFADRIGIKRGAVANYEVGRNEPIDAIISLICREFHVDEHWLRTTIGEGDDFKRRFLLALARLPEERWSDIEDFARQITAENVKEEQD